MITKQVSEIRELITQLEKLSVDGYVFRGQADSKWPLIPNAFRKGAFQTIKSYQAYRTPITPQIFRNWFDNNQKIHQLLNSCWPNWSSNKPLIPIHIERFFQMQCDIFQYNYFLHTYLLSRGFLESDILKLTRRPRHYWIFESNFADFFISTFDHSLQKIALSDGSILIDFSLDEALDGLAAIDEGFPQHYGMPTTALDWTFDPVIALYFALPVKKENGLVQKHCSTFSIYALKINDLEKSPIKISKDISSILFQCNKRIKNQQGTFSYFSHPALFFLKNSRYPTINDYVTPDYAEKYFSILKFDVQCTTENIKNAEEIFSEKDISKKSLYPKHNPMVACSKQVVIA